MFNRYQEVIERHKVDDLSDSQPTKGNIEGGLTTIEEKALGNIQKIGKKCKVIGVIDKAETPTGPGLWFMDSSSAAAEMVTLLAASGYVVHLFPTGQGNVIGNPILPVIKLSANPRTVRTMSELLGRLGARLGGDPVLNQIDKLRVTDHSFSGAIHGGARPERLRRGR